MRLVNVLVKVLVVAGVAGGMLGGAAALGSTLFEAPPHDAAEFAERVEAGSTHWDDIETTEVKGAVAGRKQRRTPAERRYVRELNSLCRRGGLRLEPPKTQAAAVRFLEQLAVTIGAQMDALPALRPPRSYRDEAARLVRLGRSNARVLDEAADAVRRDDARAYQAIKAKGARLDARMLAIYRRLGAGACTGG
ncbi:MAG: hypothetical protein ACRDON_13135 [Gaiellaceae bacterium]